MPKRAIIADQAAPAGGPYSHAVVAGDTIYLAGSVPALPDGTRVTGSFAELNEIYPQYIKGEHLPVRTTLPVPLVGFDIEIDAVLYTA